MAANPNSDATTRLAPPRPGGQHPLRPTPRGDRSPPGPRHAQRGPQAEVHQLRPGGEQGHPPPPAGGSRRVAQAGCREPHRPSSGLNRVHKAVRNGGDREILVNPGMRVVRGSVGRRDRRRRRGRSCRRRVLVELAGEETRAPRNRWSCCRVQGMTLGFAVPEDPIQVPVDLDHDQGAAHAVASGAAMALNRCTRGSSVREARCSSGGTGRWRACRARPAFLPRSRRMPPARSWVGWRVGAGEATMHPGLAVRGR